MKKFLTKLFVCLMILPLTLTSGCLFASILGINTDEDGGDGGNNDTSYLSLDGFKACYHKETYIPDDTFKIYAETLTTELYANFGIPINNSHPSKIENYADGDEDLNYDRIRVQTMEDNSTHAPSWLWTFANSTSGVNSLSEQASSHIHYAGDEIQNAYYEAFVTRYSVVMEMVLYEIVMGEEPTVFQIAIDEDTHTTKIYFDSAKTQEITDRECDAFQEVFTRFTHKGNYIGVTENDTASIKTYILESVIGSDVIDTAYDSVIVDGSIKKYSFIIDQILQLEPDLSSLTPSGAGDDYEANSIFSPYPTSNIKDYNKTEFFTNADSDTPLSHINAQEYQSIIIMPSQQVDLMGIWLLVEAEYDMSMEINVNYYDKASGGYSSISKRNITVKQGLSNSSDIIMLDFSNKKVDRFDNTGLIIASEEKTITNENGLSKYYTINTGGKSGVLNPNSAKSSYFEICFEIAKDNTRTFYPFKVGIFGLWPTE